MATRGYRPVCFCAVFLCLMLATPSFAALPFTYPSEEDFPNATTPLYFGLMQSITGIFDGYGVVPGVEVALDQINNDSSILPGYSLHYVLLDGQVSMIIW